MDRMGDIFAAVRSGDTGTIRWYLEHGGDANARDFSPIVGAGNALLHDAVISRNAELVALLILHGADVNAQCEEGWTPLLRASDAADEAIIRQLLAAGADPSITNVEGYTAADRLPIRRSDLKPLLIRTQDNPRK